MAGMAEPDGVDLSRLHRELDALKVSLCRCHHEGTCIACRGFELLREQSQMVAAAASQPVLVQVAQEVAVRDLVAQMSGLRDKLSEDTQLQELMARLADRIQDDLGGPEAMQRMLASLFGPGGFPGPSGGHDRRHGMPPEDRPIDERPPPDIR